MDFIQSEKALDVPTGLDSISFQSVRRIQEARKAYYQGQAAMQKDYWYESIEFLKELRLSIMSKLLILMLSVMPC